MRTSHSQYVMMVEFMEANGDLSKPSGGPRSRHFVQIKWVELTKKLNSDGSGDPKSEEKWRKVWSDYKNNCKKKCAKINKAASCTGGGPALQLSLNDLENRVMRIIGVQAVTGTGTEEAGYQRDEVTAAALMQPVELITVPSEIDDIDWNTPGTSSQPTVVPPPPPTDEHPSPILPPVAPVEEASRSPPQKKTKVNLTKMFIESDRKAREYARDRDRVNDELEKERLKLKNEELRVREFEVQERVRQRDVELQLQAQWLEFMKDAMKVLVKYVNKQS